MRRKRKEKGVDHGDGRWKKEEKRRQNKKREKDKEGG